LIWVSSTMITVENARRVLCESNLRLKKHKPDFITKAPDAIAQKAGFYDWIQYYRTYMTSVEFLDPRQNDPTAKEMAEQFRAQHRPQDLDRQLVEYIYVNTALKMLIGDLQDLSILQLACNYGPYLHYLKNVENARVAGIDLNRLAVDYAAEHGLEVRYGSAEMMPFGNAQFDVVISINFLCPNYIVQSKIDLSKVLAETYRTLKPGGLFISQLENFIHGTNGPIAPFKEALRLPPEIEDLGSCMPDIRYFEKPIG